MRKKERETERGKEREGNREGESVCVCVRACVCVWCQGVFMFVHVCVLHVCMRWAVRDGMG